jgi:hypothetical protein
MRGARFEKAKIMEWVSILTGAIVLFFGRRLFWLFVAASGFVAGAMLAATGLQGYSEGVIFAIALAVGVVGAILSVLLQRLTVAIAAFFAGGYLLYILAMGLGYPALALIAYLVGGILGACLSFALFDWALIGLSALLGASMIAKNLPLERNIEVAVFVVSLVLGVAVQIWQMESAVVVTAREPDAPVQDKK